MLPFKTPPRVPDTIDIGDEITGILEMPRHGSLTVEEDIAYVEALASTPSENDARLLMSRVRPQLAAIALRRILPNLTDEQMSEPPLNSARLQEALTNYLIEEKNGTIPSDPADPKVTPQTGASKK